MNGIHKPKQGSHFNNISVGYAINKGIARIIR